MQNFFFSFLFRSLIFYPDKFKSIKRQNGWSSLVWIFKVLKLSQMFLLILFTNVASVITNYFTPRCCTHANVNTTGAFFSFIFHWILWHIQCICTGCMYGTMHSVQALQCLCKICTKDIELCQKCQSKTLSWCKSR